jgi:hypothetical protein
MAGMNGVGKADAMAVLTQMQVSDDVHLHLDQHR